MSHGWRWEFASLAWGVVDVVAALAARRLGTCACLDGSSWRAGGPAAYRDRRSSRLEPDRWPDPGGPALGVIAAGRTCQLHGLRIAPSAT